MKKKAMFLIGALLMLTMFVVAVDSAKKEVPPDTRPTKHLGYGEDGSAITATNPDYYPDLFILFDDNCVYLGLVEDLYNVNKYGWQQYIGWDVFTSCNW